MKKSDETKTAAESLAGNNSGAAPEQVDFEKACLDLLQQAVNNQAEFSRGLAEVSGQNSFLRQQQTQLYTAVSQLYQAVTGQCQQLLQSDAGLQQELQKFQTGGPQRAMAGLFGKLFRELIAHLNDLDDITGSLEEVQKHNPIEGEWIKALATAQTRLERILESWGCQPMEINIGDEFDPARHRSVEAEVVETSDAIAEHAIVGVKRRGWLLNDQILQYPDVVVN